MGLMAIDTGRNVRKTLLLTKEEAAEVEDFRVSLRAVLGRVPSESAALAELIRKGLERWREEREASKKGRKS
jgi:hypothetical protein